MTKEEMQKGWRRRLTERYAQPRQNDLIVLRGQGSAIVYGCRKILQYSPERIRLQSGKRIISIHGKEMICTAFSGGAASVRGDIGGVSFERNQEKKEEKEADI
jgi:sporulation protein YqfC